MKDGESSSKAAKGRKTKETEHLISSRHGAAPSPPVQPRHSPSEGKYLLGRYPTRRPPTDLCHQPSKPRALFLGPCEEDQVLGSWRVIPCASAEPEEPRILVDMPPETVIRRPMIAGPIEGNLDCEIDHFIPRPTLM
ncbi:hypothetical protein AAG906_038400 [Vitis piasezkii]